VTASALEVATAWMESAARCDLEAVAAGMAESSLRYGEPSWIVTDKPAYIEGYRQFLSAFCDYRLEIVNAMANGRTVVFEMIESATFSGPYILPDGSVIQPSGASYADHVCTWVEVSHHGLISEIRAYIPSTRGALMAAAMANTTRS